MIPAAAAQATASPQPPDQTAANPSGINIAEEISRSPRLENLSS
jgi:hypothetical protein